MQESYFCFIILSFLMIVSIKFKLKSFNFISEIPNFLIGFLELFLIVTFISSHFYLPNFFKRWCDRPFWTEILFESLNKLTNSGSALMLSFFCYYLLWMFSKFIWINSWNILSLSKLATFHNQSRLGYFEYS